MSKENNIIMVPESDYVPIGEHNDLKTQLAQIQVRLEDAQAMRPLVEALAEYDGFWKELRIFFKCQYCKAESHDHEWHNSDCPVLMAQKMVKEWKEIRCQDFLP